MRILHTADWHLGARLVERPRLEEQAAFLDWLLTTLVSEKVDALLVSGDVFDAANPPQDALALYYDFIRRLADIKTVRTVITGGNHDSASCLNAPRDLLRRFEVHVFGQVAATPAEALIDLGDVIVAAVPYLRERDLRQARAGENAISAQEQVLHAIQQHYADQLTAARQIANSRPILAMGHLTALGATPSDSERDIHIGNLGAVSAFIFDGFDYVALGHLHRPQRVAGQDHIRYSGSPVALSFSEVGHEKSVVLLETTAAQISRIETLPIPQSRHLVRATVNHATLQQELQALPEKAWAEITVKVQSPEADLDRQVRAAVGSRCDVLKVLVETPAGSLPSWQQPTPALNELRPLEVFQERLQSLGYEGGQEEMISVFQELLALHEAEALH